MQRSGELGWSRARSAVSDVVVGRLPAGLENRTRKGKDFVLSEFAGLCARTVVVDCCVEVRFVVILWFVFCVFIVDVFFEVTNISSPLHTTTIFPDLLVHFYGKLFVFIVGLQQCLFVVVYSSSSAHCLS